MTLLRGKVGPLIAFFGITALVAGGLGWITREALQMEEARRVADAQHEREKLIKFEAERAQERQQQIVEDRGVKVRTALMMLDSRFTPALAREDSRPYPHYEAMYSPFPAVKPDGIACEPGEFLIPSPLLTAELPDWMLLHFQFDEKNRFTSPQVIPEELQRKLRRQPLELALNNVDQDRRQRLDELRAFDKQADFFKSMRTNGLEYETQQQQQQTVQDLQYNLTNTPQNANNFTTNNTQQAYGNNDNGRFQTSVRGKNEGLGAYWNDGRNYSPLLDPFSLRTLNLKQTEVQGLEKQLQGLKEEAAKTTLNKRLESVRKEIDELKKKMQPVEVELSSMQPLWLPSAEDPKHLVLIRSMRICKRQAYQGILLDWVRVKNILHTEIADSLPDAKFIPLAKSDPTRLDREMFALPIELDAGPLPPADPPETVPEKPLPPVRWTALRIGLAFAWVAALVAWLAVGLGGWTLLDLSERRIRFVSAVTHELRTPLTTLRLYLDLLNSGLISDSKQREEYLKTLGGEADRLYRLIGNVLDFARLEKTRPNVEKKPVAIADLFEQLRKTWAECCSASSKELEFVNQLEADAIVSTDGNLVEQVLGNFIDNARKYSQDAKDPRISVRAKREAEWLVYEVEDHGPGVTKRERSSIFRPFRRGRDADVRAGGVGLGLALATRWAALVGGRLSVQAGEDGVGACFRLEIPT